MFNCLTEQSSAAQQMEKWIFLSNRKARVNSSGRQNIDFQEGFLALALSKISKLVRSSIGPIMSSSCHKGSFLLFFQIWKLLGQTKDWSYFPDGDKIRLLSKQSP